MSAQIGVSRSHALAAKGGSLAAATLLAGAGMFGVAAVGPAVAGAQSAQVQVELTSYPTFAQSLQLLLDTWNIHSVNDLLGLAGFNFNSTISDLLGDLNTGGLTLGDIAATLGISLSEPIYSSSGQSLLGTDLLFQAPASFYSPWDGAAPYANIDGTPLGNVGLGKLVDLLLGGAGEGDHHSLAALASTLGFSLNQSLPSLGGLTDAFSWLSGVNTYGDALNQLGGILGNFNEETRTCSPICSSWGNADLTTNSSLNDWLSGLLQTSTTQVTQTTYHTILGIPSGSPTVTSGDPATTLGGYLQTLAWGTGSGHLADQTLGSLLNLNPNETWNDYLSNMLFGGNLFHPGGDSWGDQTLGELVSSFMPTITGDMTVTDFLEALGLINW